MAKVRTYRELIAWRKAFDFSVAVYRVTRGFPDCERFGLTSQLRRAAVSIPSNIAEGQGRGSKADFARFLAMSRGSLFEVETQLMIGREMEYLSDQQLMVLLESASELGRVVNGLIASLR